MNILKFRFFTLSLSFVMAVAVMMIAPVLMGAFSEPGASSVSYEACASSGENCCFYNAICNLNGEDDHKGFEYYADSCSTRDREARERKTE
ncbi:MAG: hypothetical protein F4100_04765 [Rhodothermaceae bacterium]|nr:hypothetical protein [Rhodothermaceae bacterium]MYE62142.1 hypothetical protein [Rhodothermaceae bacterium]MYJ20042.1 hypothetical protein [Rhodothermaceae bacterium]